MWYGIKKENSHVSLTDSLAVFELCGKLFLTTFSSASKALDLSETPAIQIKKHWLSVNLVFGMVVGKKKNKKVV